jgi:hypothetical protein
MAVYVGNIREVIYRRRFGAPYVPPRGPQPPASGSGRDHDLASISDFRACQDGAPVVPGPRFPARHWAIRRAGRHAIFTRQARSIRVTARLELDLECLEPAHPERRRSWLGGNSAS